MKTQTAEDIENTLWCPCGEVAKYNFQKTWLVTTMKPSPKAFGGYKYVNQGIPDNQDPTGEDNLFLCQKCALQQFDGQYNLTPRQGWKHL